LNVLGNAVYFWASAQNGADLWRSDGTVAGSQRVFQHTGYATNMLALGNTLYFFGDDNIHGKELMKIDNTLTNAVLVKDGHPGAAGGEYDGLVSLDNGLVFYAEYSQSNNAQGPSTWWVSDGTLTGTLSLTTQTTQLMGKPWAAPAGNTAFAFVADAQHGMELWRSDGTVAGTQRVKDVNTITLSSTPSEFAELNGELFFAATELGAGREVWHTSGTPTGTVLLKDIVTITLPAYPLPNGPVGLTTLGNRLYFVAPITTPTSTPGINHLWQSDGTPAGTTPLTNNDINVGRYRCAGPSCSYVPPSLAKLENSLFFIADDTELWKSDGTLTSTQLVKDIGPLDPRTIVEDLVQANNKLFFTVYTPDAISVLWVSDSTPGGTLPLRSFGSLFQPPNKLVAVGPTVFFAEYDYDDRYTYTLWKSNGTPSGTVRVSMDAPQLPKVSVAHWASVNGALVAYYTDGSLWKTDGTAAGTVRIASYPGSSSIGVSYSTVVNNKLFMVLPSNTGQYSFVVTDGTSAGTRLLRQTGDGTVPSYLAALGNTFIFIQGSDLWVTDATPAGTRKVMALPLANPDYLDLARARLLVGNTLYLTVYNPDTGYELWAMTFSNQPNLALNTLASVPVLARLPAQVPVAVTNWGSAPIPPSLSLTLTATFGLSLTYLSDSSGITPVVQGNTVMWRLPTIGVLQQKAFDVQVRLPNTAVGQSHLITFTLGSPTSPSEDKTVEIVAGRGVFLPLTFRQ
jgi:ELWxxDGT repeat protein